jgi:hypothetical protein
MEDITQIIIQLIGSEVCHNSVSLPSAGSFTEKELVEILLLSRKHSLAHVTASALLNNGLADNSPQKDLFLRELYSAVYAQEKTSAVFERVCCILNGNKIRYIPLKGAVIRDLYPQPWMRSSCDIDILVNKSDLKSTVDLLIERFEFTFKSESKHDVVLISEEGICLELHFRLIGDEKSPLYSDILKTVWESAVPASEDSYRYKLSDEVFYYYHILHMAKHFRLGGCGIRPFLDLWLINRSECFDFSKKDSLLEKGKLADFEKNAKKLSEVWFSEKDHDEVTRSMQNYIIDGGNFGSEKTRAFANSSRHGGKYRYFLSRVFVPYSYLKGEYKILEKYPILTPFYEIRRIFSILLGKKKRLKNKQNVVFNDADKISSYNDSLFKALGL